MVEAVPRLGAISTRAAFDLFHEETCEVIRQALKRIKARRYRTVKRKKPLNGVFEGIC